MSELIHRQDAERRFEELLDRVERGESFTIGRGDMPIARLVPVLHRDRAAVERAISRLIELRKSHSLLGLNVRDLRDESRRSF